MNRALGITLLVGLQSFAWGAAGTGARWEVTPVAGGAEIVTLFTAIPSGGDMPLVSVLRDTLGDDDPANDRLRDVWLPGDIAPAFRQRFQAAIPFHYWASAGPGSVSGGMPKALVDLDSPGRSVWGGLARRTLQILTLDPNGLALRASTRSYFTNLADRRRVLVYQALNLLERTEDDSVRASPLTPAQYTQLEARLLLMDRTLGGWVSDAKLARVREKEEDKRRQARGRNWELLRQFADKAGLYFQPLAEPGQASAAALVWISLDEHAASPRRAFEKRFLNISNPWTDSGLAAWKGHSEIWHFDAAGRRVQTAGEAVRSERMVPLALYSLEHPKAPMLVVDFRSPWKPKAREVTRRTVEDVPAAILGIAGWANWQYRVGQASYDFYRGRHGAPVDRGSRLKAYAALRNLLLVGSDLAQPLRQEIQRRLGGYESNPLGQPLARQAEMARLRHAALLAAAADPVQMARRIDRDRGEELASRMRPRLSGLTSAFTLGLARYRIEPTPERMSLLDRERRLEAPVADGGLD